MTNLNIQLIASAALIIGVLLFMWRLPKATERLYPSGAFLAIISPWIGLIAVLLHISLFFLPYPDYWLTIMFLGIDPAAVASGTLVLWLYRGVDDATATLEKISHHKKDENDIGPVEMQKIQAKFGITLGLIAVTIGYIYVMTVKPPDITPF